MCICVFSMGNPDFPFVLIHNRDEFKSRSFESLNPRNNGCFYGIDLEKGGTWLAVTKNQEIALVTNFRSGRQDSQLLKSRGKLVLEAIDPSTDLSQLSFTPDFEQYSPFNLLYGTFNQLGFIHSPRKELTVIKEGIHGFSNASLNTPWLKVLRAKSMLEQSLSIGQSQEALLENLFEIMQDKQQCPTETLPQTGVSTKVEKMLSSIFIDSKEYGTLSTTILIQDAQGLINIYEKIHVGELKGSVKNFNLGAD